MKIRNIAILIGTIFLLAACGGDDDGDDDPMTNPPPAQPRVFYLLETGVYSAEYDGTDKIQLTPDFSSGDIYFDIMVSPNRLWVAFGARLDGETRNELYVVSATGQGFDKISVLNNAFNDVSVSQTRWSPNSDALVYVADDSQDGNTEIFLVTIDNNGNFSAPQKISGSIGPSGDISLNSPFWSFDGSHIAYRILNRNLGRTIGLNTHEVGTVSGEANFSVRVSKPPFADTVNSGSRFTWSPVENRLVYRGAVRSGNSELFWVSASEDQSTYNAVDRVVSNLLPGQFADSFRWSDNGRYIAYTVATPGVFVDLNVYDDDAGTFNFLRLVDLFGGLGLYWWVPDSDRIAVSHYTGIGSNHQLTTINADGSNRQDIPTMDSNLRFGFAPDGSRIAATDRDVPALSSRLFFNDPESAAIERSIDFLDLSLGTISPRSWSPDSDQLIFLGNRELYIIDVPDGDPEPLSTAGNRVLESLWSPEGDHICYMEQDVSTDEFDLYCVNADGSGSVNLTDDTFDERLEFVFVDAFPT